MIGIKGQWEFRISIAGIEDSTLITSKNLQYFKTVNEVGNILPSFELVFDTHEKDAFLYIKEKNLIVTSIGDGFFFGPSQEWVIITYTVHKSEGKYRYKISGLLNKTKYITQSYIYITDDKNSTDAIAEIAGKHFSVIKATSSVDVQKWIQPNITDRRFISDILKYSFMPDNFILTGIDEFGFFYIKDGQALLNEGPIETLHYNGKDGIAFLSDYEFRDRTGVMSFWLGKNKSKVIYKVEDGFQEQLDINFDSYNPLDERVPNLGHKYSHDYIYNDNTHKDIQEALTRQKAGPGYFSDYQIKIFYALNQLDAVNIMTTIEFIDDELDSLRDRAAKQISGKYIVGKLVNTITAMEYSKTLYVYKPDLG